jgi:rfaE bifunctional protein kinase chain/domain
MAWRHDLLALLDAIPGRAILVVGDLCLDVYLFGEPVRLSREAPILVLEERRRDARPGGGAAPALAVAVLGASVWQAGVIGDDEAGRQLRQLLVEARVDPVGLVVDPERPTTTKTRIVAEGPYNVFPQQIARVDRQDRRPVSPPIAQQLIEAIATYGPRADAVLLSDYRSGVLVPEVVEAARHTGRLVAVDSQGALASFRGCALVKCNRAEAEAYLGCSLENETERKRQLSRLRAELECELLVVTLGPAGAALASVGGDYTEMPPLVRRQVFDVTGAGDTVIAALTVALAAGAAPVEALRLSQVAAGIVVGKWGNAQATADEIRDVLRDAAGE